VHYTKEFLLNKIAELEAKLNNYKNPCLFCGPDSLSVYVCEDCQWGSKEVDGQLELDCG
jgi:hypothetical protein